VNEIDMNPFSLLSKGETVKGLKNRGACYKMVAGNALPNFSNPKRPTHAPSQPEPAAEEGRRVKEEVRSMKDEGRTVATAEEKAVELHGSTESRPAGVEAAAEEKPAEAAASGVAALPRVADAAEEKPSNPDQERDAAAAAVAAALMEKKPAKPGVWSVFLRKAGGWIGKWLFRGKGAAGNPSVQAELALEKVTVIRNDLSEDDLEVVEKAGRKTVRAAQIVEPGKLATNP
jgi:hypothetical protein